MEHQDLNLESKEFTASWAATRYFAEALQIEAAEQNSVGHGEVETTLIGKEHSSLSTLCSENLESLTIKSAISFSMLLVIIALAPPKSGRRGPILQ
jgi:hypothetical protein